jgi:S1/P1 Nuclease
MKSFITILALLSSGAVFAWGNTGHRVVGEVASRFLEIEALVKTNQILDGQSLARVSTWPDEIKSDAPTYQYTFNWHYTTWQTEAHDHSENEENATTGLLLKSINEQIAVLKDPAAAKEKKAFALKFLVHLVGDIHQPLHVGNGTDQGGNFCKVTYMAKPYNLHSLWDEGMIDFSNLSFTELARFVYQGRSLDEIRKAKTGSIVDWARESKELVPTLYPADVTPSTEPMSIRKYCQKEVLPEDMPKLSYEYAYKHLPVIEKRLFEAGVRLAVLLNEALK